MKVLFVVLLLSTVLVISSAQGEVKTCPGATVEQHAEGTYNCAEPGWNYWYYKNSILLPSADPTRFYQMTSNSVIEMRCAPGTCFSQVNQQCVHGFEWINPCQAPVEEIEGTTTEYVTEESTEPTTDFTTEP